jgi:hypothetical protein
MPVGCIVAAESGSCANTGPTGNDAAYTLQAFVYLADRGAPVRLNSSSDPTEEETSKETPVLELQEGEYPDYEDLVESGCITYMDPAKNQLGPRIPNEKKKGSKNRNGRGRRQGNQQLNNAVSPKVAPAVDVRWGSGHTPAVDDGW